MPQNAGSDAKTVPEMCSYPLQHMVSIISACIPIHVGMRIGIIPPAPNSG